MFNYCYYLHNYIHIFISKQYRNNINNNYITCIQSIIIYMSLKSRIYEKNTQIC